MLKKLQKKIKKRIKIEGKTAELYCYLSKAKLYSENYKSSLRYAKKALKISPDYIYAKVRLILAYAKLQEEKKAYLLIDELFKEKEHNLLTYYSCFIALINLNNDNERLNNLAGFIAKKKFIPENKPEYDLKIETNLWSRKYKTAEKYILEAEEKGFADTQSYNYISYIYYIQKKYKKSLIFAERAIQTNNKDNYAYYCSGWAAYKLKEYDKALEYLKKAHKYKCKFSDIYNGIAFIYINKNDYENSLKYTKKIDKKLNPYNEYGKFYYNKNKDTKALKNFLAAEKTGFKDSHMFSQISYILACKGRNKKSLEYANKALLMDRNNEYAHYRKGFALYKQEDYKNAKKSFLQAEELNYNDNWDMFLKMSYIYSIEDDYKTSLKYANKALILKPDNGFAHYRKGYALFFGEKYKQAAKCFIKAEELGYTTEDMVSKLAYLFYTERNYSKSLSYINKALLLNKDNSLYYYIKAEVLTYLGKREAATKCYNKALLLESN